MHAALATVHTAVVGIGLACVRDADARLAALLRDAIADTEAFLAPVSEPSVEYRLARA
jgi:hypothetical protein